MNITNEIISAYIDNLYTNENEKLEELRSCAEEQHVPIIQKDTEKLLKVILKLKEPADVLEIGTAVGYSSCVFADCCGCRVLTIESDEDTAKAARDNIENLDFSKLVEVCCGDARDVLKAMDPNRKFDIIFIASIVSTLSPAFNLSPGFTKTFTILHGIGAVMTSGCTPAMLFLFLRIRIYLACESSILMSYTE